MSSSPQPESAATPYIPPEQSTYELTLSAVAVGAVLGVVFGASSLYLMLKVGMTVSASIPVAVLSITLFRGFSKWFGFRRATILENNIVQTTGSAGESIAFGVGATMPALLILGFDLDPIRVMMVSCLGGLLGILMMIPLRKAFIVNQHGKLPYPEGTACAKVLVVGEQGGANASKVFFGFGLAFLYQTVMKALGLWKEEPGTAIGGVPGYPNAHVGCAVDPALLGVGYIIGPRIASTVVAGGFLASLMLIPAISYFGSNAPQALAPAPSGAVISQMGPGEIFGSYVKYIGAGAVAMGGFISMLRALPLIFSSAAAGIRDLRTSGGGSQKRTERDLPMWMVGLGSLLLVGLISASDLIPTAMGGRLVGAGLIILLGFLFVTVSSRMTGEIGSSSNPISGMTIATLLVTCLVFWLLGWVGSEYRLAALCIAGVVCIASSNGGTTSQDLKTGYLVGATPSAQQIAILVGSFTSAICIGFTILLLNSAGTIITEKPEHMPKVEAPKDLAQTMTYKDKTYKIWNVAPNDQGIAPGKYLVGDSGKAEVLIDPVFSRRLTTRDDGSRVEKFTPPQATLFATIIDGVMTQKLPWGLVIFGAVIAVVVHLTGGSALAFAVGLYLPLSTTLPIFLGGLIRAGVDRAKGLKEEESDMSPGVLTSTGFIAGGTIAGILFAVFAAVNAPSFMIPSGAYNFAKAKAENEARNSGIAVSEPEIKIKDAFNLEWWLQSRSVPEWSFADGRITKARWTESNVPALAAFGAMMAVLVLIGAGVILREKPTPADSGSLANPAGKSLDEPPSVS